MGAATIATSFLAAWEDRRYGRRIDPVSIDSYPVFVLGFWRFGMTLLHNLLAEDTERFIYPAGYQVFHPHTFLTLRSIFTIRNRRQRRGIDDFPTGPLDPQEDEIAMLLLTLESPYLQLVLPSNPGLTPPPDIYRLPPNNQERWKQAFLRFAKKVTLAEGPKSILFKSPPHTSRIRILLELFPKARFGHIYRNPYHVFRSACKAVSSILPWVRLGKPTKRSVEEEILRSYTQVYDSYFQDRERIPSGYLAEVSFERLTRNPVQEMPAIYRTLDLSGFDQVLPRLARRLEELAGYRKNKYPELSREARQAVAQRWRRIFDLWGYPV